MGSGRIDLDSPVWDQNTFMGRLKYFAWVTDPRLSMCSTSRLLEAKNLLNMYRCVLITTIIVLKLCTVEFQWLKHLLNNENMSETG